MEMIAETVLTEYDSRWKRVGGEEEGNEMGDASEYVNQRI